MSAQSDFQTPVDNDYASRTGQSAIPVTKDDAAIEDPIDPETADSDATLGMSLLHFPIRSHLRPQLLIIRSCRREGGHRSGQRSR